MPPKLSLMPASRMATRAKNKDQHPGYVDLPSPQRARAEKGEEGQKTEEEKAAEEIRRTQAQEKVLEVQTALHVEDKARDLLRREERISNEAKGVKKGTNIHISNACEKKATVKSAEDLFVSDEDSNIPHTVQARGPKRSSAVQVNAFRSRTLYSSSGEDGSIFESDSDSSSASSSDSDLEDNDEEQLTDETEYTSKKRKKTQRKEKKAKRKRARKVRRVEKRKEKGVKVVHGMSTSSKRKVVELAETFEKNPSKPKKQRANNLHGIDPNWDAVVKKHAAKKIAASASGKDNDEDNSMVKYGGIVPEDQTDGIEADATEAKKKPLLQKPYPSIKIEDNGVLQPKTMKEARGGDEKWKLKHLGNKEVEDRFTKDVVPCARKKAGSLEPWANISTDQIRAIVDEVFGANVHEVVEGGPWVGLINAHMHNWCNGFAQHAMDTVDLLIAENRSTLTTKELVAEQIAICLEKEPLGANGDIYMYAYQWREWGNETRKREGFGLNALVIRTFALAHLAYLNGIDDFSGEKPIGALILAMQAVGRALEHWKEGEKPTNKPPAFSADNFADTWVATAAGVRGKIPKKRIRRATIFVPTLKELEDSHWDAIINEALAFLPESKKKVRDWSSSSTIVEVEEDDPDAGFILTLN